MNRLEYYVTVKFTVDANRPDLVSEALDELEHIGVIEKVRAKSIREKVFLPTPTSTT